MPVWLIIAITVAGYLAMVLVVGALLSYVKGRRDGYFMDNDEIILVSVFWPMLGLWVALGALTRDFWRKTVSPIGHCWQYACTYGKNYEQRKRARAAKRQAKLDRKQAEQNLQREFVDLCKQNGWDPKQVMKQQKKKVAA